MIKIGEMGDKRRQKTNHFVFGNSRKVSDKVVDVQNVRPPTGPASVDEFLQVVFGSETEQLQHRHVQQDDERICTGQPAQVSKCE